MQAVVAVYTDRSDQWIASSLRTEQWRLDTRCATIAARVMCAMNGAVRMP